MSSNFSQSNMANGVTQFDFTGQSAAHETNEVQFLKSTLVPRNFNTAPPNVFEQVSFIRRIDFSLNFIVGPQPVYDRGVNEAVPTSEGLLLWHVKRGVQSIYRMGIVPQGSVSNEGNKGLNQSIPNMVGSYMNTLSFEKPLALPYARDQNVVVGSNLSEEFSSARMYAGVVDVQSDTLPSGSYALNGRISAGNISDTRDIAQTRSGAYSSITLTQTSLSSKDAIKNTNVHEGVTTIIGSDMPSEFTQPDHDMVDYLDGSFKRITRAYDEVIGSGTNQTGSGWYALRTLWVSPWGVTLQGSSVVNTTIEAPAIDEAGVIDIDWFTGFSPIDSKGANFDTGIVIEDIYAVCREDGTVHYHVSPQFQPIDRREAGLGDPDKKYKFSARPRMGRSSMLDEGKYIGTAMTIATLCTSTTNTTFEQPQWQFNRTDGKEVVVLRARSANRGSALGPARVIRWEGVGEGQALKVSGMANVQVVPQADTATLVRDNIQTQPESGNVNMIPLLSTLFNGPGMLRRVWPGQMYRAMVEHILEKSIDRHFLLRNNSNPEPTDNAIEAAGLFKEIGSQLGQRLGGMAGDAADLALGPAGQLATAGQFGARMNAGGQFGAQPDFNSQGMRRARN